MAPVTFLSMVKGWGARGLLSGTISVLAPGSRRTGEVLEFAAATGYWGRSFPGEGGWGDRFSSRIRELLLVGERPRPTGCWAVPT